MGETGSGKVQFFQMRILFARAHEADLQFGIFGNVAPGERRAQRSDAGKKSDHTAQPQIVLADAADDIRGHGEDEAVQFALRGERLEICLAHRAHPRRTPAAARMVATLGRTMAVVGRRREFAFGGRRWKILFTTPGAICEIAERRDDDRGIIRNAFGADTSAFDRQNEGDVTLRPALAFR